MNVPLKNLSLAIVAILLMNACAEAQDEGNPSIELAPGFDLPVNERVATLPAYQTEAERERVKADRFDIRGNYQDIFGFTSAPRIARAVAEFERSDGVLMAWDNGVATFLIELVDALDEATNIYIVTWDESESRQLKAYFADIGVNTSRLEFFEYQNDTFWTRDYGPIMIADATGAPAFVDARYYPDRTRDDAIPTFMSRYFNVPVYRPPVATEGGNFMSNGEGLCVVTEWFLQENPGLTASEAQQIKRDYFGCAQTVVLERMDGEGTGHVDMFAKFVSEDTVLVGQYTRQDDRTNAAILDRNAQRLAQVRLANGSNLRVVRIPMPQPDYPVYRSYTNSVIANNTVVVPIYPSDRRYEAEALEVYRQTMPNYRIVTVDSDGVIELGGAVHCTTMGFATGNLAAAEPFEPTPEPEPQPEPTSDVYASEPALSIVDLQTVQDSIFVEEQGTVNRLFLELDIDHTYVGDLVVYIEHNGEYLVLQDQAGGNAQGLKRQFDISAFAGREKAGEWTLVIEDRARQDVGRLNSWALSFED